MLDLWFQGKFGYAFGEAVAVLVAIIAAVLLWFYSRAPRGEGGHRKRLLRTTGLCALCFGIGISIGIEMTAKGTFWLPLRVMQDQMHELYDVPLENLQPSSG
jgi:4-hydroxybenzoate polyprenyltransferase